MSIVDLIQIGSKVVQEIEEVATLQNVGDKADLAAVHIKVHGKRLKLCIQAEVEG